jgi:acyl-coenzyme A thioesterase PaaI-like protein
MTRNQTAANEFEPEFVAGLTEIFEQRIVFNRVLGLKVTRLQPDGVAGRIEMKPDLVGHFAYQRLHGGVISASLDAMAGLAVMAAIGGRHLDETPQQRLHRFSRLGTTGGLPAPGDQQPLRPHGRSDAARLARGLGAHGVSRRRRSAGVHRLGGLHRLVSVKASAAA